MGAQQSTQSVAGANESLYEILGVERNATDVELKKAYRKQALVLHPDRNYNQEEEATARFAKVQAAYDVLSDPQERAWYDSHGSGGPNSGGGFEEYGGNITTTEELEKYMDPTFYQDINKRSEEFFEKISQLFNQLRQEEAEAALDQGEQEPLLPAFGNADSKFDREVKPFYDTWSSFNSIKTFAWEDIYRAWDAPDRRTRRAAEQRNKKIREASKKEFNSAVRQLVNLIKSKDPRVKQNNKQKRAKPGNSASKEQAKRDRQANASKRQQQQHYEQDWERADGDEDPFQEFASGGEDGDDEGGDENGTGAAVDLFECVVCDKLFKTKKQLNSHESSKKHAKAVAQLKREMRREGVELGFDENISGDEVEPKQSSSAKKEPVKPFPQAPPPMEEELDDKQKVNESESLHPSDDGPNNHKNTKSKSEKRRGNQPRIIIESDSESEEDDITVSGPPASSVPNKEREKIAEDATLDDLLAQLESSRVSGSSQQDDDDVQVKGKAKKRRQKKAKQVNEFALRCSVCQTEFSSRNKLFEHVKASGHAAPVPRKKK